MPARTSRDHVGSSGGGGGGGGRKRYAATVMKGDNAWRSEWGSFMSGINLKRVRDGSSGVALRSSQDLARLTSSFYDDDEEEEEENDRALRLREAYAGEPMSSRLAGQESDEASHGGATRVGDEEEEAEDDMGGAVATYAYLFNSPAERRAEREAKQRAHMEEMRRRRKEQSGDPLDLLSKHQRTLVEAQERGLALDGMTRKEKRSFLRLTVSKEQQEATEHAKTFKLHDLMDEKIAWYQQGPHPIDLIAEKLVSRKAEKKAKQMSLKYNYLRPHPSWVAKRAQHRRERLLVGLGRRFVFDDDGQARDPLRNNAPVDLTRVSWLLVERENGAGTAQMASLPETADGAAAPTEALSDEEQADMSDADSQDSPHKATPHPPKTSSSSARASSGSVLNNILVDPLAAQNFYVRAVVKDRQAALALQKANLSTTFLSNDLVRNPKEAPPGAVEDAEDGEDGDGGNTSHNRGMLTAGKRGRAELKRKAAKRKESRDSTRSGSSFSMADSGGTSSAVKRWEKKLASKFKKAE